MASGESDHPLDRTLFSGHGFHVGRFHLQAHHPRFTDTGPALGNLLVFSRSSCTITHAGRPAVHADANVIMLYNAGQEYRRGLVDPRGDFCDYFHFDGKILQQAIAPADPTVADRPLSPFRWSSTSCSAEAYFLQRSLVRIMNAANGTGDSTLQLDHEMICESLFRLLELSLSGLATSPGNRIEKNAKRQRTWTNHRQQVRQVLAHLYLNFDQPESIEQIASRVDLSPFHMSRVFAAHTGHSIHAYRNQLRLRRALEYLEAGTKDITSLAVRLGYASHSHFGQAFRAAFGVPPSQLSRKDAQSLLSRHDSITSSVPPGGSEA